MKTNPLRRRLAPALGLLAPFLPCAVAAAAQAPASIAPEETAQIESAIRELMSRRGIPGLSIAVVEDDRIVWQQGYGLADVENCVPARASTAYRIASVSKALTAVAAMRLAEQGKLDLDAPIQTYVPAFPAKPWTITARQLLGHLGGIRNYRNDDFGGLPENTRYFDSLSEALSLFQDDPLDHEPGTKYSYTTFGYTLLGVAMERASGTPFMECLRENVLGPAQMTQTRAASEYEIVANRSRGYTRLGIGEKFQGRFPTGDVRNADLIDASYKIPGGGLISTVEDLAKFAIAVQNGVIVSQETFARMTTRQQTFDGEETPYGLGWYVGERTGARKPVWHGGVQKGVTSTLYLLPEDGFAVAILTNLEGGGALGLEDLAGRVAGILLEDQPARSSPR